MKPCIKCGEPRPPYRSSLCRKCKNEYMGEWKKKNRDKVRAAWNRWRDSHLDQYRIGRRLRQKRWRENNPDKNRTQGRRAAYKHKYNVSITDIETMLKKQSYKCASCKERFIHKPQTDHCHKTGAIRGMLCIKCNLSLGLMDEDPKKIRRLAEYIENSLSRPPPSGRTGERKK